jgi:uncharacterized protein (TIGR04255 family)
LSDPPYAQDTLRFVAAEVRFPIVEELGAQVPQALRDRLKERFPIQEALNQMTFTVGATGPGAQQAIRQRFMPRDRLMSVTVGPDVVVLETTAYKTWTDFRDLFMEVLSALADSRRPDGYLRLGLRYIDEIRVPADVPTFADWRGWVADALVEPFAIDDAESPTGATITLQYGEYPGYQTLFKAAPFASGRTVQAEGPLLLPFATPDGPYFLVDTDASWLDQQRAVPEFEVDAMTEMFNNLHVPCKRLFERSVGPRLRDEVLDRPREEVWGE